MSLSLPLLALAFGAFGIGVTEFSPMGVLPLIASDLGVSIPRAGLLVSAYAVGVLIGAPLMTLALARVPRRRLLLICVGLFTLGNLVSGLADGYWTLLAGRIITSLNHGAFFGVGAVVAASIVPANRRAGAVAAMFSGLTLATIAGVPLATAVAEHAGWRVPFLAMAGVGVLIMLALRVSLPVLAVEGGGSARAELAVLLRGPVLAALLLTVVSASAMFTVFTYIVPILHTQTHASSLSVTVMLTVYGCGLAAGNWLGGRLADRSLDGTLIGSLVAVAALLVLFVPGMASSYAAAPLVFLWGIASFALVPPLQMRVVSAAASAPNLASAMNIGAFNLGNALGAALGGAVIDAGLGYPAVPLAGAATAVLALVLALALREPRRPISVAAAE